ncbi:MAG: TonB-dependent receptor [Hyphomonadaceae bacterium]|nr:TonB-dependent receptor [Hyphomonadaceae bacterium]
MRKTNKPALNRTSALFGVVAALLPIAAHAQDAPPPAPAPVADAQEDDDIIVTGTRIRNAFNSPSPIQIIVTDRAEAQGISDVSELIQNSSLASGSPQNDATISSAFVTDGGPGSQTVSLRGLGANRTLVLLNGRRAGPAGTRGAVSAFDFNVLPLSVVDRVEILKDGASSIYGSDAVAGVVNIITRRDLDGGEANIFYSQPFEDGGEEGRLDLSYGRNFSRGHFNVVLDYYNLSETRFGDRDYTNCAVDNTTSVATGERNDVLDVRTGQPACRGNTAEALVWLYDFGGGGLPNGVGPNFIQYDPTGTIGQVLPQTVLPGGFAPNGDFFNVGFDAVTDGAVFRNGAFERQASFIPNLERTTFYAEGDFDLTNNAELYAEVLVNRRESSSTGARQMWTYLYSEYLGDPFSAGWGNVTVLSPTVVTNHFDASQTVDYFRGVLGARGDFAGWLGDVNWDIYVQDSISDGEYRQEVILEDALTSAAGRSDFGSFGLFGQDNSIPRPTASCVGYVTPISNRACVDVNWLSPTLLSGGGFTAEEDAFLFDTDVGHTKYEQQFVEGSVSTDLFALPAGNVAGAFGFMVRRDEIKDTPGEITLSGNSWGLTSAGITQGSDTTREVYGELLFPLLAGAPLAESLDVTLSGRYTDVESYGENSTYKIGANWQITSSFMLRATHGTSFRAPALFELYLASQTGFGRQVDLDPCINWQQNLGLGNISQRVADNCAADGIAPDYDGAGSGVTIQTSGGAGLLEAETSEATVVGFVWSPQFIDFNLSVDYFEIEVNDEVDRLGAAQIVYSCYNSIDFPTDPLCNLFTRGIGSNPFLINTINDSYLNVNSQLNRGIDVTALYEHAFPWGDFTAEAQFTYQLEDTVALFAGTERDTNGANGDPELVGSLDLELERGDWTFFWGMDFIGETDDSRYVSDTSGSGTTRYDITAEAVTYHSASVEYEFDTWSLLAGVANIFDQEPPTVSTVGSAGQSYVGPSIFASQYDYLGRRAFIRVQKTF